MNIPSNFQLFFFTSIGSIFNGKYNSNHFGLEATSNSFLRDYYDIVNAQHIELYPDEVYVDSFISDYDPIEKIILIALNIFNILAGFMLKAISWTYNYTIIQKRNEDIRRILKKQFDFQASSFHHSLN